MPLENWLAFVAASAIMLAIPGPTILLVISYALGHGRKASTATVTGVALGDFTAMTASMLGLGALLATSAALFTGLKWIGAGLTPLRPSPKVDEFIAKDPFWKPLIDGIAYGGPEPLFTDYKGFQDTMIEMVQSVVTGKATPEDAAKKASSALEQYK